MIHGIGTDIVSVARMQANLDRYGDRFARRILGEHEYEQYQGIIHPARFLAKRFAVKEAVAKALGTGLSAGVQLRQICVEHDDRGKPRLAYSGQAATLCREAQICHSHVSISDEAQYAVAFVVLESQQAP
ncbi:MAG: holo-ACP synthase [Gammaproteobacteria bacterium]|nr:holo-ACP synthase [Gammaproteobacteria bacterium]